MATRIAVLAIVFAGHSCSAQEGIAMEVRPELQPVVEIEDEVYGYEPADNGAAPMWCYGCTCLVRIGDDVFVSGLETLKDFKPLNNVRWTLFKRGPAGWELQQVDEVGRTREPCPIVGFPDGRLFLSANPTLVTDPQAKGGGPARPEILRFAASDPKAPYETLLPAWEGTPAFNEHSYRTFSADGPERELILFQNIGLTHSEWAFRQSNGQWVAGKLQWPPLREGDVEPYGGEYARCNYPDVVLKDRVVHFCGAAAFDSWERVHGGELAGRKWGSRWRRLYYTWAPDITGEPFREWVEIANTNETGGWLFPGDLWVAPDGAAHVVWYEAPIHKGLRDKHFPDIKRVTALKYAIVRDGQVISRQTLVEGGEGMSNEIPGGTGNPRFQVTLDNRLFICYYVHGSNAAGERISENRLMELRPDGTTGKPVRIPLEHPLSAFFTATTRGGSLPSETMDLLGYRVDAPKTLGYARVRLW